MDRFFSLRRYESVRVEKPRPDIPHVMETILKLLEREGSPNKVDAAYYLLDLSGEGRYAFASNIERVRKRQAETHNQVSASFSGRKPCINATLFVDEPHVLRPYDLEKMRIIAASLLIALEEPQHVLIVLYYDSQSHLIGYHFERFTPEMYDENEVERLRTEGKAILQSRVDNHIRHYGSIGRNELCPCGSGRKYKRCHGR